MEVAEVVDGSFLKEEMNERDLRKKKSKTSFNHTLSGDEKIFYFNELQGYCNKTEKCNKFVKSETLFPITNIKY